MAKTAGVALVAATEYTIDIVTARDPLLEPAREHARLRTLAPPYSCTIPIEVGMASSINLCVDLALLPTHDSPYHYLFGKQRRTQEERGKKEEEAATARHG